jgi:exoribonuclease R
MSRRLAGTPLDFGSIRKELGVPGEFTSAALSQAAAAAGRLVLPDLDRTDIPFITVDPSGSKDLDQALHIAADGDGYLVSYAIADVASFVEPGSALDVETRQRGETLYFPDARVPLHPTVLSEGAASLLPGQLTPAVLWQIGLDNTGQVTTVDVRRARVRSREQWDYEGLQKAVGAGTPPDAARLLCEVGALRQKLARARHAISLDLPEQIVEKTEDGSWSLRFRAQLEVEAANAEISLLTGMCAARLMLDGGVGLLRTVPPPDERTVATLRRIAPAMGIDWPDGRAPGDVLATLDPTNDRHEAFIDHAAALMRGSAYDAFHGAPPEQPNHSGIGGPYAHVTAPLRRLVDRFGSEVCLALCAGTTVPQWVLDALPELPEVMRKADALAHAADRAVVDATEAFLLQNRIGERFTAVVLETNEHSATIAIEHPAIRARCDGTGMELGTEIQATLRTADVASRSVRFEKV